MAGKINKFVNDGKPVIESEYPIEIRLQYRPFFLTLTAEELAELHKRYYTRLDVYKLEKGHWPNHYIRTRIQNGLQTNFKLGRINNSAYGRSLQGHGHWKKKLKKLQAEGWTLRMYVDHWHNFEGRATKQYEIRVKEAELRRSRRKAAGGLQRSY